ncbi:thioesterase II family protein [Niallia sp. FSL W8-1348]|uniref:thioesterase II family protein n=1 Tax=Niallia sp. FSL W8-1348 TaxID=2954656 RepID=UPI0030F594C2
MKSFKLFCFPFAGGSSEYYRGWFRELNKDVELIPVEIAGRGKRFGEKLQNNLKDMVDDIFLKVKDQISPGDHFGFFGHSMGGLLSYNLALKFQEEQFSFPEKIFISSTAAPDTIRQLKYHTLPEDAFITSIKKMGSLNTEVLDNKDMRDVFIPILRSDFQAVETCKVELGKKVKSAEVHIMYGKQDKFSEEEVLRWQYYFENRISFHAYDGDHFYIEHNLDSITELINKSISVLVK